MRLWTLSIALLTPWLVLAAPVPKAKEPSSFFPMTVGDTREYEWRTGDTARAGDTDVVTQVEMQKDGSTHVTIRRTPANGKPNDTVIRVADSGLSRVSDGGKPLAAPVVLLKLPATVGTKWEDGVKKYEVKAEEEITVAAGKFQTVKVELNYGTGKTMLWFAPSVGLVKMSYEGAADVLELKAFKHGK